MLCHQITLPLVLLLLLLSLCVNLNVQDACDRVLFDHNPTSLFAGCFIPFQAVAGMWRFR